MYKRSVRKLKGELGVSQREIASKPLKDSHAAGTSVRGSENAAAPSRKQTASLDIGHPTMRARHPLVCSVEVSRACGSQFFSGNAHADGCRIDIICWSPRGCIAPGPLGAICYQNTACWDRPCGGDQYVPLYDVISGGMMQWHVPGSCLLWTGGCARTSADPVLSSVRSTAPRVRSTCLWAPANKLSLYCLTSVTRPHQPAVISAIEA